MKKDELIDQHGIEVCEGACIARPDLAPGLSVFDDGRNEGQGLFEAEIHPIGERRQNRTRDSRVATYVAHQVPKVRTFTEECDRVIDEHMKFFERSEGTRGDGPNDGKEFVASSRQRFR